MRLHILKIKEEYMKAISYGEKTFELRENDRDYQVGDLIHFVDLDENEYLMFNNVDNIYRITYVLKDVPEYGLDKDYCILGIKRIVEK